MEELDGATTDRQRQRRKKPVSHAYRTGTGDFGDAKEDMENKKSEKRRSKEMSEYSRDWITENAKKVLATYEDQITLRQLYYRLVAAGMTNDVSHYKKVINAMTDARWKGEVDFEAFIDRERGMYGETEAEKIILPDQIEHGKNQVKAWMEAYHLNRWENQPEYIEVWIEKKALQGVFENPCRTAAVGLAPCKGYPSLTFLKEAQERFELAIDRDQNPIIEYFGDYDPSGEDIPRAVKENLARMGCDVEVERIALHQTQITEMNLPSVPAKLTDTRTRNWGGAGVVELDAVEPKTLSIMVTEAISKHFDRELYKELKERETTERAQYQEALKSFVGGL